jgi:hypothetical protein
MPSRMIDFDNLWTSDKLAACKESTRVEYTWLYGLADAHGTFEINLRAIHSRVSAIRPKLSVKKIDKILEEFHQHGMLFKWESNGKIYGFWTGSDKSGRLPKRSERHRYKRFAPDVPEQGLADYESRFRRDAVANESRSGVGFGLGFGLDGKGYGKDAGEGVGSEGETETASVHRTPTAKQTLLVEKRQEQSRQNYCDYCDRGFINTAGFLAHRCDTKTAGGYECSTCHSTFPDFHGLKSHRSQCSTVSLQRAALDSPVLAS